MDMDYLFLPVLILVLLPMPASVFYECLKHDIKNHVYLTALRLYISG